MGCRRRPAVRPPCPWGPVWCGVWGRSKREIGCLGLWGPASIHHEHACVAGMSINTIIIATASVGQSGSRPDGRGDHTHASSADSIDPGGIVDGAALYGCTARDADAARVAVGQRLKSGRLVGWGRLLMLGASERAPIRALLLGPRSNTVRARRPSLCVFQFTIPGALVPPVALPGGRHGRPCLPRAAVTPTPRSIDALACPPRNRLDGERPAPRSPLAGGFAVSRRAGMGPPACCPRAPCPAVAHPTRSEAGGSFGSTAAQPGSRLSCAAATRS